MSDSSSDSTVNTSLLSASSSAPSSPIALSRSSSSAAATVASSPSSSSQSPSADGGANDNDIGMVYDEPIWTTKERFTLYEKMTDLIKQSNNTITRELFDQQLIEHMKEQHNAVITATHIKKQIQSARAHISKVKQREKEKESEMKEWEIQKAAFELKQQQEREDDEKKREKKKKE